VSPGLRRRLAAEALGTAALVATVVGSGIMADAMSPDDGVALLGNTLATGAILVVLITTLGPVSGAHFNPAVSLGFFLKGEMSGRDMALYLPAQIAGGLVGTLIAHAMFEMPLVQASTTLRSGGAQWLSEGVAAFGLMATILAGSRFRPHAVPWLVGLFITAGYWFTASTSFANPAVTIARAFTDTFAGIRPADAPGFILAQILGAGLAVLVIGWLLSGGDKSVPDEDEGWS